MYHEIKIPKILKMLTSKNNPTLNLKGPRLTQLPSGAPNPNDFDKIKNSLTTPSGNTNPINIERAVLKIHPNNITDKIKYIDFLCIII